MSNNLLDWMLDDITWCLQNDCPMINCMRNPKNMRDPAGPHSYAAFYETEECPIYVMEKNAEAERDDNR